MRFSTPMVVIAALFGVAAGVGSFTFVYAKGYSYMTNDPRACANCHVMHEQYDGWVKGSHATVATCNDCHAPHDLVGKYWTKARNGFWHSYYFTTGGFHEPIRITPANRAVTEGQCRHCHADVVTVMDGGGDGREPVSCLRCHHGVGHMEMGATDVASAR
ncbi:MAG: cytochrome c nitrite reductase small subunit [Vicinamibacteria bacterium]|nr:cytochrome c nitrite reductase small subunit [Vicinamibacteria bacterium]